MILKQLSFLLIPKLDINRSIFEDYWISFQIFADRGTQGFASCYIKTALMKGAFDCHSDDQPFLQMLFFVGAVSIGGSMAPMA